VAEARTATRFTLELPIDIREGASARKGKTADVSAAGVLIRTARGLKVGAKVEFDITVPGEAIGTSDGMKIRCKGRVVRTDTAAGNKRKNGKANGTADEPVDIACVIDSYKFLRD
jgi:hypothetical protein